MACKSMEDVFLNEFNVKKDEWNRFIRASIEKM
jgi:hypothetical protein